MALTLPLNLPVSQPKPQAEPLPKESPRPVPLNAPPPAQPRKLHQADAFVSAPTKPSSAPQLQVPPLPGQSAPAASKGGTPTNAAADDQAARGWKGDATFVFQDTPTDCGTANLAQICGAAHGQAPTPEQHKQQVERNTAEINNSAALKDRVRIHLKDGATPAEMAALLGKQGQKVVRGFDTFAADYMNGALQQGQLGLTLLDSNVLRNAVLTPEEHAKGPGALHWVTVDGIDDAATPENYSDDRYRVKDPIHGVYWVTEAELKTAVAQARAQTGSGGVLIVENEPNAKTREAREALALQNLNHTAVVGKGNGIGSKRTGMLDPG